MNMETHYTPLALEGGNIDQIHWDDKNLIPIVAPTVHHVVLHSPAQPNNELWQIYNKIETRSTESTSLCSLDTQEEALSCVAHSLQFCAMSDKVRPVKLWPVVCAAAFITFTVNTCLYICWILVLPYKSK